MQIQLFFTIVASLFSGIHSACNIQGCDKYYESIKNDRNITGSCAVMFDENCCKAKGIFGGSENLVVIPRGAKGKLCGSSSSLANAAASVVGAGPASSCIGPNIEDDIESFIVMPGCTLEVWDKDVSLKRPTGEKGSLWYQEKKEKESANAGFLRDAIDKYNRNKISLKAVGTPNWIEELNDDFEDMNEDIATFRCTC